MKNYISMLLVALFAFVFSANAGGGDGCCKKTECCKNCTDDNCKDTCTKISKMSKEEKKSAEGKKLIIACKAMCEKNKFCYSDTTKSCKKKEGKGCCKH
jgi:hypothetical protein